MNPNPHTGIQRLFNVIKGQPLGMHQREEFLHCKIWWLCLNELGGRVHDVARGENNLSSVAIQCRHFFTSSGRNPVRKIFVPFRKIVGLENGDVFDRSRIGIDEDIVDHFQRSQIHRPQFLRDVWAVISFFIMSICRKTGDEEVRFALGIHEVSQVAGMDDIEHPMAHDHFF